MSVLVVEFFPERADGIIESLTAENNAVTCRVLPLWQTPQPEAPVDHFSHIILSGGPSPAQKVMNDTLFQKLLPRIQDTPTFGICLGAQVLALLAGAEMGYTLDWQRGWQTIRVTEDDPVFQVLSPKAVVFQHHRDYIRPSPELRVTANSPLCAVEAFRVAGRTMWGIQGHPEVSPERGARILGNHSFEHNEPPAWFGPSVIQRFLTI